jgi:ribonucleoside-diphosphate reductase alpha chain
MHRAPNRGEEMDDDFEFTQEISKDIFNQKYCLQGETSVKEVFMGIAAEIASVEKPENVSKYTDVFYALLDSGKFIPAGRVVANARPLSKMKNYMNCYVVGIGDSMPQIYTALLEDALIGKMGGGVGINFSSLRPLGMKISKGGESSGPLSFMEVFDASAEAIHTGGGRRGAHMGVLNCDHPDIESFISYKQGDGNKRLQNFNISVGITDAFMQAVEANADWDLVFEGKVFKTVKAVDLYNKMMANMYQHNEPGVFFLDEVNRNNNGSYMYDIQCPNPCAEQPLPVNGCCCLGSLNLTKFVSRPFTSKASFDHILFMMAIYHAVRFLDNVISASDYPTEAIRAQVLSERRIGLGFTGLADMFAMLGIPYGSEESAALSKQIAERLRNCSYDASMLLAIEKGKFPAYDNAILEAGFIKRLPADLQKGIAEHGLRNIALNTVAPTGTTSLSLGNNCSSGIEPIFALEYTRNVKQGDNSYLPQKVYSNAWLQYKQLHGEDCEVPEYFATSDKISINDSIRIQSIFQQYIDASISKTITLPDGFTEEHFHDLILQAWKAGLKGITTYNPNGSLAPILTTKDGLPERKVAKRAKTLPCKVHSLTANGIKLYAIVGIVNDAPYEVFLMRAAEGVAALAGVKTGKMTKCATGKYDFETDKGVHITDIVDYMDDDYSVTGRMLSLTLRHGIDLQFVVDQLNKTKRFDTFSKAVARVLKTYLPDGEKVLSHSLCPECGEKLSFSDGCVLCPSCGWSKC